MNTTDEVIDSYKLFLEIKYPTHHENYCRRLSNNSESAKAEAVTFSLLRHTMDDIKLAEDVSTGGADFLCTSDQIQFIAEVTCLEAESVGAQSGWPNQVPQDGAAGWFGMITHMLRTKASSKTAQLSGYDMPRVLVITSEHVASDVLLGPHGAETLLTSDTKIEVPVGKPIDKVGLVTDLKDSVFFRFKDGAIESCKRSVSAILLISIVTDRSLLVGILHPDPQYKFPIKLLPSVPFLRVKQWPPEDNNIKTEWIIHKPRPGEFYHQRIVIKDEELRTI
jgi:hypothetical protein